MTLRALRGLVRRATRLGSWTRRARIAWERLTGLDFTVPVAAETLGLDPRHAVRSSPSGNRYLHWVLRDLPIGPADCIIDIGCGKGSAMRTMLAFPFRRVDGLEISAELADIARANFSRLRIPAARCRVITGNAADFCALDEYGFVYFYHPFSCQIMAAVIGHLLDSLARSPRPLWIIYNNPVCDDQILATGRFRKVSLYPDEWGNGISVYSNQV